MKAAAAMAADKFRDEIIPVEVEHLRAGKREDPEKHGTG